MATHSSIHVQEIPWAKEPGVAAVHRIIRIGHDLATKPPPPQNNFYLYIISHDLDFLKNIYIIYLLFGCIRSQLWHTGPSLWQAICLPQTPESTGSGSGSGSVQAWAPESTGSVVWHPGLVAPWHMWTLPGPGVEPKPLTLAGGFPLSHQGSPVKRKISLLP